MSAPDSLPSALPDGKGDDADIDPRDEGLVEALTKAVLKGTPSGGLEQCLKKAAETAQLAVAVPPPSGSLH